MLYAVRANRQYPIEETEKQKFIDLGYKIAKLEKGKLMFDEVEAVEGKEVEELKKERTTLKGQLTKANNRIEELEKELKDVYSELKGKGK